ncbi:MAG: hypothetical protein UV09_C0026G0009 [Candidatus Gottesmanbacteria bacterium GW2011_GWA2_42_18]|uniref:Uncharacterized protein n=1 Tax=Candidatus Gottesmanbacteria bacterium GW2011_GWA2_42_18 TaxID=1618442 RepID=A0A0G0ZB21_9BACT|nr:MAG: hypothetical protein UV09_C0026G0009 [Candidatus Gottesmanbacteria bacterium GW2011_GWA2_42_18]KKS75416.1 MAG: hypothetical protein UV46_C0019G0002 [Candidatus Gottesmanbacteria bacterium GW2011_GWC2_42_8]
MKNKSVKNFINLKGSVESINKYTDKDADSLVLEYFKKLISKRLFLKR